MATNDKFSWLDDVRADAIFNAKRRMQEAEDKKRHLEEKAQAKADAVAAAERAREEKEAARRQEADAKAKAANVKPKKSESDKAEETTEDTPKTDKKGK